MIMEQDDDCEPKDLSMKCSKRLKPIPPPLNLGDNSSTLKEFAIIATSPKSPLMQKNLPFRKRAHSLSGACDIRTQPFITAKSSAVINTFETSHIQKVAPVDDRSSISSQSPPNVIQNVPCNSIQDSTNPAISVTEEDVTAYPSSESSTLIQLQNSSMCSPSWSPTLGQVNNPAISSVLLSPVGSSREELNGVINMHPWPTPVWHCFQPGTLVKWDMPCGGNSTTGMFRMVEELGPSDWIGALQVEQVEEEQSDLPVCIHFYCLGTGVYITAQCHPVHTFFVKDKGWCAACPERVALRYQVLCQQLERGDVCYPPQSLSPDVCDRFKRFSFPPEEIPVPTPFILSPPSSPCKKPSETDRPKRPMNAFMLFAKRYRLELIQMHPGKDNRAISVILGEAWRKLPPANKEEFVLEARAMAQEQKRLHPDCWKRKRSHSTS
ncbi:hypothetical protein R5R35_014168 [Gryllus longicercus]|uniref:HMG box-containing protein 1 n=1 Tax=Gryllus longicercus TaxID=2509291 RepID=A0AAN9VF75_9ORTH